MTRKLKRYVIPSALATLGVISMVGIPLYYNATKPVKSNYKYEVIEEKEKRIYPVINEVLENKPLKPYLEETVSKTKDFYRKDDDEKTQSNSLIYYENTYMPNTGILYSAEENFEVVASLDGKVTKIGEDDSLGKYVELEHANGYKTTYYSLSETSVTEGSNVTKGDVVGTSGANKIYSESNHNLLFEVYKDGHLIDPEDFMNIDFALNN